MTAGDDAPTFEIEFYEDDEGHQPARAFMKSLTPMKRRAIGVAIDEVLAHLGPDVASGNFGKNLGQGLYELRLDQDAEQILRRKGKAAKPELDSERILLRVFFHAHGKKLILLLSGYDKGEHDSKSYQQREIEHARALLRDWKRRLSAGR